MQTVAVARPYILSLQNIVVTTKTFRGKTGPNQVFTSSFGPCYVYNLSLIYKFLIMCSNLTMGSYL